MNNVMHGVPLRSSSWLVIDGQVSHPAATCEQGDCQRLGVFWPNSPL